MAHPQAHIQKLLEGRYYLRDEAGNLLETEPEQMFSRVAYAISQAEETCVLVDEWGMKFYALMAENKFLPNTPTLINAGKERAGCFSACFTLPVPDSMEGIFEAVKQSAIIMKAGGGIGFNFGRLREEGAIVKTTGHKSSGPISFMKVFDSACDTISQGGVRRGAMMGILPVWHPDIFKFIEMKDDGKSFSNFNISVGITDDFMGAVLQGHNWFGKPARNLWEKIVEHAHKTGDPGLIFLDTINRTHPLEEEIEACNPCGELPLRPYESCNLGSINLMAYLKEVRNVDTGTWGLVPYIFDWDALEKDIPTMVRFLDDVIDVNPFPLPEIEKASKESRKIGLGIMGWADCLIKMKIPYDSQEALDLAEKLMLFINYRAALASANLGEEKGSYPLCSHKGEGFCRDRRNATLLCVAPTGSLSRIAGVSSGIEPIFAWKTHHKLVDLEYDEIHWVYKELQAEADTFDYPHAGQIGEWPNYTKTANEIGWEWHLAMQAAFQKHVDNSISKTINLSSSACKSDVDDIFMSAWEKGLKGITIYRDGSKDNQPLNKIPTLESYKDPRFLIKDEDIIVDNFPSIEEQTNKLRRRGPVAIGVTHKVDTGKGKVYITINYSEYHSEPVEVFIRLGYLATPNELALAEWSGRLISLLLKYDAPLESIIRQGNKVFADSTFWYNGNSFNSFPKLISHLLGFTFEEAMDMAEMDFEAMMENGDSVTEESEDGLDFEGEYCYNCGVNAMIASGGCKVCQNCGYEKCGG